MAVGMSTATANSVLDAIFNATAFSYTNVYIQLHTADPGAAGTTAVATETDRLLVSMAAATGGTITNDAALEWTGVAGTEDYTHFSLWTATSGGTFIGSGTITANAVTAGDTFRIPASDLDFSLSVAS